MNIGVIDFTRGEGMPGLVAQFSADPYTAQQQVIWVAGELTFPYQATPQSEQQIRDYLVQAGNLQVSQVWFLLPDEIRTTALMGFLRAMYAVAGATEPMGISFVRDGMLSDKQHQFPGIASAGSYPYERLPQWAKEEVDLALAQAHAATHVIRTELDGTLEIQGGVIRFNGQPLAPKGASVPTQKLRFIRFATLPGWAKKQLSMMSKGQTLSMFSAGSVLIVDSNGNVLFNGQMVVK